MLLIIFIIFFPLLSIWLVRHFNMKKWLSPVVLCYGIGILIANFTNWNFDKAIVTTFSEVSVLLAIPLLLFSTDLKGWFKHAPSTLLAFGLVIFAGLFSSFFAALIFQDHFENTWLMSAMLTGIYTGGVPNLQAVGLALDAPEKYFVLLNLADILTGGIYLLFLTSIAHYFLGKFLPNFQQQAHLDQPESTFQENFNWIAVLKGVILSLSIVGISVGLTYLITGKLEAVSLIILGLTSLSILASTQKKVRNWAGTFQTGEYLLLIFCIAIGLLADFSQIGQEGLGIVFFTAFVLILTIILHFLLCYFFKIDRDTAMITSTAAIYGPVFIGQVASSINNKVLVFSGMATGLIGYAIGNYLGIGMGILLRHVLE